MVQLGGIIFTLKNKEGIGLVFSTKFFAFLRQYTRTLLIWTQVAALAFASILTLAFPENASAALLTSRKVTITSSKSAQTGVSYAFAFTFPSAARAEGIMFQFCTSPLGACTLPTSMVVEQTTTSIAAQSFLTTPSSNTTAFSEVTANTGDCNDVASTMYCVSRTETENETNAAKSLTIGNVTNPTLSTPYSTVYVRIKVYNNNTFTPGAGSVNIVQEGAVAAGITQQLTTQGRVQERLEFCVAAIGDGGNTDTTLPANCGAIPTTTTIDIGIVDNASIVYAPVDSTPTNGANDFYGIAMINTNAAGGVVLTYYPEVDTNVGGGDTDQLRSFRVAGADCSATTTNVTDQCFVNASTVGETFTAGTERFGLYIPCIDTTQGTTTNLGSVPGAYNGSDNTVTSAADCENPGTANTDFAWDSTGTAVTLATSSSVVDDEIVKISFGATASATTPTGLYRVTTTYVATPTF
jgi:hypothetical protein